MKLKAKEKDIKFSFSPTVTSIQHLGLSDIQKFIHGAFFRHCPETDTVLDDVVEPCAVKKDRPNGYEPQENGLFKMKDVYLVCKLKAGTLREMQTTDGVVNLEIVKPSSVLCNLDEDGEPVTDDSWVIEDDRLEELYEFITKPL